MTCRPCRKQRRQSVCKSRTEPGDAQYKTSHIPVKTRILKGQQKMKVESEDSKTSTNTEELSGTGTKNPSTNPKDDEELDEGEIVDDNEPSTKPTAVIHEPHPLEHSWTFWFHNPSGKSKQATWDSSRRSIYTFSTVEQFWSLYNNIDRPSKLAVGADSYFFKHEIKPNWEDPVCANGGKWTLIFSRRKSDQCWLYTLLALIGEQFDHGDEICGVVVNVRVRQEKIALWTKNAANEAAQLSIGKQWKELLDYHDTIGFIFHEDAKHSRSAKKRYTA